MRRVLKGIFFLVPARIFKEECPLFAAGEFEKIINLFNNSLEHMGYFSGHKEWIECLCTISNKILASGSGDSTIKIWNIVDRSIMSTLSGHTKIVIALCNVNTGVLVSGSGDNSLIIWSKSTPESSIYSPRQTLTGHTSEIRGIIRLNSTEIVSGEWTGDLMIWNIDQGLCLRHISARRFGSLYEMKQHIFGEVAVSYWSRVHVWGAANDWDGAPIKQFISVCKGCSIEFLSGDLLLRGGDEGELGLIDYTQTEPEVSLRIKGLYKKCIFGLHSECIFGVQRVAKNIVITISLDGCLKVIDPIFRRCYMKFKARESLYTIVNFY